MGSYGPALGLLPVAGIVAYLAVLHLSFWQMRREDRLHLWVAAWFTVSLAFVVARYLQLQQLQPDDIPLLVRVQITCAACFCYVGVGLANSLTPDRDSRFTHRLAILAAAVLTVLTWATSLVVTPTVYLHESAVDSSFFALRPGRFISLLAALSLGLLIYGLRRIQQSPLLTRRQKRLLTLGFVLSVAFAVNDILQVAFDLPTVRLRDYGSLAVGVAFSLVIVERSGQIRDRLESEVMTRTRELERRNEDLGVALRAAEAARRESAERAEALASSESRFRTLIEGVPDGLIADRDGRLVYANPRAHALLDSDASTLVGESFLDCVHRDERAAIMELRSALVQGGEPSAVQEVRLLRRDGRTVYAELVALGMSFDGAPSIVTMLRDNTDRRELRAQLVLADRMASVGTLAAGAAHELNNPLTLVMNNAQVLVERTRRRRDGWNAADLVEVGEILEEIKVGAERVRHVVKELETFSRADSKTGGATDLRHALATSVRMVTNQIRHRARLIEHIEATPLVDADDARLGQIFVNLLVNAAQAIPEGHMEQHEIHVRSGTLPNGHAFVEISDNGRGIAPQTLPRIFDPFFTTRPVGEGAGLGLSICHSIVTALGGTISLQSELDKGTTVRISLPSATLTTTLEAPPTTQMPQTPQTSQTHQAPQTTQAPETPDALTAAAPVEVRKARVLIVDDEPFVARALSRTLAEHSVVSVQSAKEALALLASQPFDVVFCDLMMPNMTGMDLFEAVRTQSPGLEQSFIFMTGGAFTPRARDFIGRVENPRLEKPFDPHLVRRLTASALERSSGGGSEA